jgi:hypothetical protein
MAGDISDRSIFDGNMTSYPQNKPDQMHFIQQYKSPIIEESGHNLTSEEENILSTRQDQASENDNDDKNR